MRKLFFLTFAIIVAVSVCSQTSPSTPSAVPKTLRAVFETSDGNITCELFPDKAPITVQNFVGLATGSKEWTNPASHAKMQNRPMFDGTIFHRVIPGFMIQGGDPLGNGRGDGGFTIADEFYNGLKFDIPGRLAMANEGRPHTGGSQFFITEVPTPHLNGHHTIFGQCEPISVVSRIARTPRDPNDKPFKAVKLIHVQILKPGEAYAPRATPAATKK